MDTVFRTMCTGQPNPDYDRIISRVMTLILSKKLLVAVCYLLSAATLYRLNPTESQPPHKETSSQARQLLSTESNDPETEVD